MAVEPHGEAAQLDQRIDFDVRRTSAKNGAPRNAVTTPIGSSAGEMIVRASDVREHEEAGAEDERQGTTAR